MGKRTGTGQRRRAASPLRVTPTWDGGAIVTGSTGQTAEIFQTGQSHDITPGRHHWIIAAVYCADIDAYDAALARNETRGVGVLGPDRLFQLTPIVCSECSVQYTPEERRTICSGEVPDD